MKLLYLTAYSYPEQSSSSHLGKNKGEAYRALGWSSLSFTPTPTRGVTDEIRKLYSTEKKHEILNNGLTEIRRFNLMREGSNSIGRAFRYFLLCVKLFNRGAFCKDARKCNVMFVASTPPILGATSALVTKFNKIPYIYNLQDIFPDSLAGTGLAKKGGLLWKIGRVIEDFTYKHADKIIVISEDFKKNIMAKGVPEEKIVVIYNWVDQNEVENIPREDNKLFDMYGLDRSKFYVTYNGNIGLTQNMDMLLNVAEEFQTSYPDIHFVLVGNGAYLDEVKRMISEKHLENVHSLPFQPYEDISHVFSLGDISLVISKPGVGANSVPSKTWSIMSASRPVLANFDPNELKDIMDGTHPFSVNGEKCGIFTMAGDKEAFKTAILKLYNNRELCKEYGANGRRFIMANLTKEVGTQKYVDVIKSVVK